MYRGVKFGNYHSAIDWELILNEKKLDPATPKTTYISIDGRDGDIDASEMLTKEIKYNNRQAIYKFIMAEGTRDDRETLLAEIFKRIHGRSMHIVDPDDVNRYLVGRCTVKDVSNLISHATFTVEANCEPWKYSNTLTTKKIIVDNSTVETTLENKGVRTLLPEIIVNGSITLEYGSSTVALETGTYKLTNLLLRMGSTPITVEGTGEVSFIYREAVL